jgi:hypothetical protein
VTAVAQLDRYGQQPLKQINAYLLLGAGKIAARGIRRSGVEAIWAFSWPEQQSAGISPIIACTC